MFLFSFFLLWW